MCKLETGLIDVGQGICSFRVYRCAYLLTYKLNSSIDFLIFLHLSLPSNPSIQNAPTCASSSTYRCPVSIASSASGAEPHACNYTPGPVWSGLVGELSSMSSSLL